MTKNGSVEVRQEPVRTGSEVSSPRLENAVVPPADILETAEGYIVLLDMPGAEKDSIGVTMHKDALQVTANVPSRHGQDGSVLFSELESGGYTRSFTIGHGVDRNRVEAGFENGVLRITLRKTDEVKPRQITIR